MFRLTRWKLALCGVMALAATGCMGARSTWMYPHAGAESLGQTPDEHRQQIVGVLEQDRRSLTEDLDLLFMTDRPTRLTRWHGR